MLDYINLKNFKSLVSASVKLSDINLLIGINRTGKSSIIQSFALLKQSRDQQEIIWSGPVLNLGDFESVLSRTPTEDMDTITLEIGGRLGLSPHATNFLGGPVVKYQLYLGIKHYGLDKIGYAIKFGGKQYSNTVLKNVRFPKAGEFAEGSMRFTLSHQFFITRPIAVGGASYPQDTSDEEIRRIDDSLREAFGVFTKQLELCVFVPTARGFDRPFYTLLDWYTEDVPTSEGLTKQAEVATSNLAYKRGLAKEISKLVKRILPDVEDVSHTLLRGKQVQVTTVDATGQYNLMNEGFGVNQLIFLFHQLVTAKQHATVFIEEPEIALHPAAQSALASTLVDVALKDMKQLVVTTHSEHVLLGMLEEIIAGRLKADQLKVYYLEKEGGVTKITKLDVNEKGEIKGGLKGFFEADMEHLTKFLDSLGEKGKVQ